MATETNYPKKARLSQPQVHATTPDETLRRYHVEMFNPASGKAKDARFEEINLDLYKPKAKSIAFSTSEERIGLWIRCLMERYFKHHTDDFRSTWEEQDSPGNADRCDRIILHLYARSEDKKEQHVAAITVFVSTGTFLVQGKFYQQFSETEFPLLLQAVNKLTTTSNPDDLNPDLFTSTPLSNLWNPQTSQDEPNRVVGVASPAEVDTTVALASTPPEVNHTGEFLKTVSEDIQNAATPALSYTPSRLHTISSLRTSMANMESEFVAFKMEMTQNVQSLQDALTTPDSVTKDKFTQSENALKLRLKKVEEENKELIVSNETLTDQLRTLSQTVKKLQDQVNSSRAKQNTLEEKYSSLKVNHDNVKEELESLKKSPVTQCNEISTEELPARHETPATVISPDVSLNNRFEVLQEEQEESAHTSHLIATPEAETPKLNETRRTENQQNTNTRNSRHDRQAAGNENNADKANIVVLCDSNGKYLKPKKLCPNKNTTYLRCPTVKRGCEIIATLSFDSPELILIHTGTNDLDHSGPAEHLASEISKLVETTAKQYPSTRVLYSTLLPRQDVRPEDITTINSLIQRRCSRLANVHLIDHTNLHLSNFPILHDSKHLNRAGVKLFAKNLKSVIYGRRPTTLHRPAVQNMSSLPITSRLPSIHHPRTPASTYAAVVQQSLPTVTVPAAAPPLPISQPLTTQQQMDRNTINVNTDPPSQGGTMNISIPTKMLPLIQFFNNLI